MFHLNAESTEGSCMEHEELCTAELTYAAGNAQLVTYSYLGKAEPVVGTIATAMQAAMPTSLLSVSVHSETHEQKRLGNVRVGSISASLIYLHLWCLESDSSD